MQFQMISSCNFLCACEDLTDERMFYIFSVSFVTLTDINHRTPRKGRYTRQNHHHKSHFKASDKGKVNISRYYLRSLLELVV